MQVWRARLLWATVIGTSLGYAWMWRASSSQLRVSLLLLSSTFAIAAFSLLLVFRRGLTANLVSANFALGSVLHLLVAGIIVGGAHLARRGVLPGLSESWIYWIAGALGVGAALFAWVRVRGHPQEPSARVVEETGREAAPQATETLALEPEWAKLEQEFQARDDQVRNRQLRTLERIARVLDEGELEAAVLVVRQEVMRLSAESAAATRTGDDDDPLSQVAAFFEWGAQKLPELVKLDLPDLLLAQLVAEIRATHDEVVHLFVDHRRLRPIHPIDRPTAEAKADERARALRNGLELVRSNGMRLSEDLIAAHDELRAFTSLTGFQVVQLDDGDYVTFEGNGRRAAVERAMGDEAMLVEVREYRFANDASLRRVREHIARVQEANGVRSEAASQAPVDLPR